MLRCDYLRDASSHRIHARHYICFLPRHPHTDFPAISKQNKKNSRLSVNTHLPNPEARTRKAPRLMITKSPDLHTCMHQTSRLGRVSHSKKPACRRSFIAQVSSKRERTCTNKSTTSVLAHYSSCSRRGGRAPQHVVTRHRNETHPQPTRSQTLHHPEEALGSIQRLESRTSNKSKRRAGHACRHAGTARRGTTGRHESAANAGRAAEYI